MLEITFPGSLFLFFQWVNNKGAVQNAMICRLVCAFVVCLKRNQRFSHSTPLIWKHKAKWTTHFNDKIRCRWRIALWRSLTRTLPFCFVDIDSIDIVWIVNQWFMCVMRFEEKQKLTCCCLWIQTPYGADALVYMYSKFWSNYDIYEMIMYTFHFTQRNKCHMTKSLEAFKQILFS